MAAQRFKSFGEFWPFYLAEHSKSATRVFHGRLEDAGADADGKIEVAGARTSLSAKRRPALKTI